MRISHTDASFERLNVLIVDDDELLGEYVALELAGFGCETTVTDNGAEALDLLEQGSVDLLVTDWQMPGMDGMALVRQVRARRKSDQYLHIAMMTAREDAEGIHSALQAGVDDFLYKPLDPVQLELAVESARRNRLLHRRLARRNELLARAHQQTRDALRRVQGDIQAAAKLHERLLPSQTNYGAVTAAHIYRPAASLGGDTIGVSHLPHGGVLFFVIDVMGHGVPAALNSFHLHHRLKQLQPSTREALVEAMETISDELAQSGDDQYATGVCGIVLPDEERGWLVRAGHPAALMQQNGQCKPLDGAGSMPLGLFAQTSFEALPFAYPRGSRIMVYSDGLTEALGLEHVDEPELELVRLVCSEASDAASQVTRHLEQVLGSRAPSTGFEDDVSLLVLDHAGEGAENAHC
jgi:sigma-B regulation protein RsbU (phosphoserine phosphatase)